jgi:hypothetical protein
MQMISNTREINQCIDEVFQLKTALTNLGIERQIAADRFGQLSDKTRSLFFRINTPYINLLVLEPNPGKIEEIKQEMLRECDRVISYQRNVLLINTVSGCIFRGKQVSPQSSSVVSTSETTSEIIDGVDIGIPNTIAYDANEIPAEIAQKGVEINRLMDAFDDLPNPPEIPEHFDCTVAFSPMAIPVFDASHPEVQKNLNTLRQDLNNPAKAKEALDHNRGLRHTMDSASLEEHFINGNGHQWRLKVDCPSCRHPQNGSIDRRFLRIDTKLQDEILRFLKNAVPAL